MAVSDLFRVMVFIVASIHVPCEVDKFRSGDQHGFFLRVVLMKGTCSPGHFLFGARVCKLSSILLWFLMCFARKPREEQDAHAVFRPSDIGNMEDFMVSSVTPNIWCMSLHAVVLRT